MERYRIGDLVFSPIKGQTKFDPKNDQLFIITRYINANKIVIGAVDVYKKEVNLEYIVSINEIKKYLGKVFENIQDDLVLNGYFLKQGDSFIFDHSNGMIEGYLPILGINYQVAHFH